MRRTFRTFGRIKLWPTSSLVLLQFPSAEALAQIQLLIVAQLVRVIALIVLVHERRLGQVVREPSRTVRSLTCEAELTVTHRPSVHQIVDAVLRRRAITAIYLLTATVVGLASIGRFVSVVIELAAALRLLRFLIQIALFILRTVHIRAGVDLLTSLRLVIPVLALLTETQNAIVNWRAAFGSSLCTVDVAGQIAGVVLHDQLVLVDVLLGQVGLAHVMEFAVYLSVCVIWMEIRCLDCVKSKT